MSTTNGTTNGHTPGASAFDEDVDLLYAWMPPQTPAPAACPEAVFSLTLKGTLDGVEALLTARGQTAAEFKANLQAIRGLLDAKPSQEAPAQADTTPQCPQHGAMTRSTKGRCWYCPHKLADGSWCPHKGR